MTMRSTLPSPSIATGAAKKSKLMRIGLAARMLAGIDANARRCVTDFRIPGSSDASAPWSGKSSGSTHGVACSRCPNSPNSFGVIAIWCGPRRPRIVICSVFACSSASMACPTISDPENSARVFDNILTTSSATLPLPMTTTCFPSRGGLRLVKSGCPLYQPTKAALPKTPGKSPPRISRLRSFGAPVASTTAS